MTTAQAAAWLQAYLSSQGGSALGSQVRGAALSTGHTPSTARAARLTATAPWVTVTRHARDSRQTVWSLTDVPPVAKGNQLPAGLDTGHATAYRHLMNTVNRHHKIPCRTDPHWDAWTSTDSEDQEYASTRCSGCPVQVACHDYAATWKEKGGVWGGRKQSSTVSQENNRKAA